MFIILGVLRLLDGPLYHHECPSLPLIVFLVLKSSLSEIVIDTQAFISSVLTWHIFLHPFTLSLSESSYLKRLLHRTYNWVLSFIPTLTIAVFCLVHLDHLEWLLI